MNILILTTHLNPGGISRYVINLAKGLVKQDHRVWIACSGGQWTDKLNASRINYKFIPIRTKSICSIKVFLSFLYLRKFISQEKIDIIHSNTRVTQFLGFLIYKKLATPYVCAYHGFYRPSIFRKLLKFSGLVTIAVSKAVGEHLVRDLWIDEDKIKVVYNGVDASEFSTEEARREDLGFQRGDYLIGILGRISEEKGHFLAVEAIKKLSLKYDNVYLLISGKGKLEDSLREFVQATKMQQRVKFLNYEPNKFLDIIDLLVVPSKKEGFGYSIVEAFVKGVPVIGYNVGGISEIIKNRKNGIIFYNYNSSSLIDAIEELILKESLRRKIVAGAKEDIWFFSHTRMAIDTEKVYREVLK